MTDVYVLTEGVEVEGMSLVGAYSTPERAKARAAQIIALAKHPQEFGFELQVLSIDHPLRPLYPPEWLAHPWIEWNQ